MNLAVTVGDRKATLTIAGEFIQWLYIPNGETTEADSLKIAFKDILAVKPCIGGVILKTIDLEGGSDCLLRVHDTVILYDDVDTVTRVLLDALASVGYHHQRRHFLVLLNQKAGPAKGKCIDTFHTVVKPLLDLAGIIYTVRETSSPDDILRVIGHLELSAYEGILSGGGDGSLSMCVNALLTHADVLAGSTSQLIPVGQIPLGTENYYCKWLHGTNDVITATLKVIQGRTKSVDVYACYAGNQLLGRFLLVFTLGWISEFVAEFDRYRFLGHLKYLPAVYKSLLFSHPTFDAEVHYLNSDSEKENENVIEGPFLDLMVWATVSKGDRKIQKDALNDGNCRLYITFNCGRMAHLEFHSHVFKEEGGTTGNYKFVEEIKTKHIRIKNINGHSSEQRTVILDGEQFQLQKETDLEIRVEPTTIRFFC